MLLLILLLTIVNVFLSKYIFRNYFSLPVVYNGVFVLGILLFNLKLINYDNFSDKTYIVILCNIFIFSFFSYFFAIVTKKRSEIKNKEDNGIHSIKNLEHIYRILTIILVIISLFKLAATIYFFGGIQQYFIYANYIRINLGDRSIALPYFIGFLNYFISLCYLCNIFSGVFLYLNGFKDKYIYLSFISNILFSFSMFGRSYIIFGIILFSVSYLLTSIYMEKKIKIRFKFVVNIAILLVLLDIAMYFIRFFRGSGDSYGFTAAIYKSYSNYSFIPDSLMVFYGYITNGLANLNYYMNNLMYSPKFNLAGWFIKPFFNVYSLDIIREYINTPYSGNIYTGLVYFLEDFGFYGVFIYNYVFAFIGTRLYMDFLYNRNFVSISYLSILYLNMFYLLFDYIFAVRDFWIFIALVFVINKLIKLPGFKKYTIKL